ncbi:Cys-rich protein [Leptospira fluminis]|uniref:Cys-rich protein n=1 Tax=Leptospira fluminis TaxID=2484979 RepID=A0A4R9GMC6_9LEPT|nr:Cys-rich protein [Leptospira fluminis]TGK17209.1 Cys-rich protein [Leptospira fluminis]
MKKNLLFTLLFSLFVLFATASASAQNPACGQICDFYTNCVESQTKKKLTAEERPKAAASCLATCRKNFPAVTQCYESHANQCVPFNNCLINAYKAKEKK